MMITNSVFSLVYDFKSKYSHALPKITKFLIKAAGKGGLIHSFGFYSFLF